MKKLAALLLIIALTWTFSGLLKAQERHGAISGEITGENGTLIPGVLIEATSNNLIKNRLTVTDESGEFHLQKLSPGIYNLKLFLEGYKTIIIEKVQVTLGNATILTAALTKGDPKDVVTSNGKNRKVDTRSFTANKNRSKKMFSILPKRKLSALSVATSLPGPDYESEYSVQSPYAFNDEWATAISFDGSSPAENTFFIDGVDTTALENGGTISDIHIDFIEDVQVKSSGFAAQYSGAMGGVINVVTRNGGNRFHGDLILNYDADWLTGAPRDVLRLNPTDNTKAQYMTYEKDQWERYEVGFALGGSIIKDKLWFFGSFLPQSRKIVRDGQFSATPELNGDQFTSKDKRLNGSLKFSGAISRNLRFSLGGTLNRRSQDNLLPALDGSDNYSQDNLESWENWAWKSPAVTLYGAIDLTMGSTGSASMNFGYYRTNSYFDGVKASPTPRVEMIYSNYVVAPPCDYPDLARTANWSNVTFDSLQNTNKDISRKLFAQIDLSFNFEAMGYHNLRVGFGWSQIYANQFKNATSTENWSFFWKQGDGTNSTYTAKDGTVHDTTYGYVRALGPYGTFGSLKDTRLSFYFQDTWRITKRFSVNAGLRLEKEDMPTVGDTANQDAFSFGFKDKFAPRLGFVYDIKGDGSSKVFGSFGIYYDTMKIDMAIEAFGGTNWTEAYYDIATLDWTQYLDEQSILFSNSLDPVLEGNFYEAVNRAPGAYGRVQNTLKPTSTMQIAVGYQQKLTDDIQFTARFQHHRMLNIIEDFTITTDAGEYVYVGNPGSDLLEQLLALSATQGYLPTGTTSPKAKRNYYALQLSLDKQFSNNWMGGISLTLSSLRGLMPGLSSSDEHGVSDPGVQRYYDAWYYQYDSNGQASEGPLPTDRPIRVKAYGAYTFDFGLTFGFTAYAMSGTPISREFLLNNQAGWYPEGRATDGRTPFTWQLDLYAEYNLKLGSRLNLNLNANITNVTNNKMAQRVYNRMNGTPVYLDNDAIHSGFDVDQLMNSMNLSLDPRFLQEHYFLPSIAVRLGAKLSFQP